MNESKNRNKGFASMDPVKQREIASKGGKAHSAEYMREIGSRGGKISADIRRAKKYREEMAEKNKS